MKIYNRGHRQVEKVLSDSVHGRIVLSEGILELTDSFLDLPQKILDFVVQQGKIVFNDELGAGIWDGKKLIVFEGSFVLRSCRVFDDEILIKQNTSGAQQIIRINFSLEISEKLEIDELPKLYLGNNIGVYVQQGGIICKDITSRKVIWDFFYSGYLNNENLHSIMNPQFWNGTVCISVASGANGAVLFLNPSDGSICCEEIGSITHVFFDKSSVYLNKEITISELKFPDWELIPYDFEVFEEFVPISGVIFDYSENFFFGYNDKKRQLIVFDKRQQVCIGFDQGEIGLGEGYVSRFFAGANGVWVLMSDGRVLDLRVID